MSERLPDGRGDATPPQNTPGVFQRLWRRCIGSPEFGPDPTNQSFEENIPDDLSDEELIEWLARQPQRPPSVEFQAGVMDEVRELQPHPRRSGLAWRLRRWLGCCAQN